MHSVTHTVAHRVVDCCMYCAGGAYRALVYVLISLSLSLSHSFVGLCRSHCQPTKFTLLLKSLEILECIIVTHQRI